MLASGQSNPTGIAVDDEYVYWTSYGLAALDGTIMKVAKAGVTIGSTSQPRPWRRFRPSPETRD